MEGRSSALGRWIGEGWQLTVELPRVTDRWCKSAAIQRLGAVGAVQLTVGFRRGGRSCRGRSVRGRAGGAGARTVGLLDRDCGAVLDCDWDCVTVTGEGTVEDLREGGDATGAWTVGLLDRDCVTVTVTVTG
eukprot:1195024-Prorocentrum_minimum.AAC.2